jgi:hypothetical protein
MAEPTVALAAFANPVEAELARNRLEAEGIPAFLIDTSATNVFFGMGIAAVKLYVPEAELERARAILASPGEDPLLRRMNAVAPLPYEDAPAWTACPDCGSEVSIEFDDCPACGTAVEVHPDPLPATATAHRRVTEAGKIAREQDLLERAWRAAVMGFVWLPGLFHLYSFGLLLRIAFSPSTTGAVGWKKYLGALTIDLAVFFALGFAVSALLNYRS